MALIGHMRKLTLFIAASLDGFIAREDHSIDWLFSDQDYGYSGFYKSIDTIVLGRKTYELALKFDPWPYPGKKCYVITKQKNRMSDRRVEFCSDVLNLTKDLIKERGKSIWLEVLR